MKTTLILLGIALLTAMSGKAKTLEISVPNVRSDKGTILIMATVAGSDKPLYGMAPAKLGGVVALLEGIDTDAAEVSLFHDEDGDYQMKMGDRGPLEGYARRQCNITGEHPAVEIPLTYHADAAPEKQQTE